MKPIPISTVVIRSIQPTYNCSYTGYSTYDNNNNYQYYYGDDTYVHYYRGDSMEDNNGYNNNHNNHISYSFAKL